MDLSPVAKIMLKAAAVAYPEALTIAPKTELDEQALRELRENELLEQYDMWPNGDRRWLITPAGQKATALWQGE